MFANAGITEKGTLLVSKEEREGKVKPVKPDLRTLDVNLVGVIYCMDRCSFAFHPGMMLMLMLMLDSGQACHPLHLEERTLNYVWYC